MFDALTRRGDVGIGDVAADEPVARIVDDVITFQGAPFSLSSVIRQSAERGYGRLYKPAPPVTSHPPVQVRLPRARAATNSSRSD